MIFVPFRPPPLTACPISEPRPRLRTCKRAGKFLGQAFSFSFYLLCTGQRGGKEIIASCQEGKVVLFCATPLHTFGKRADPDPADVDAKKSNPTMKNEPGDSGALETRENVSESNLLYFCALKKSHILFIYSSSSVFATATDPLISGAHCDLLLQRPMCAPRAVRPTQSEK